MSLGQKELITVATFPVDEILPHTGAKIPPKEFVLDDVTYIVRMDSKRYITFSKSRSCLCCGLEGTVMALQLFAHSRIRNLAHFNLYGPDNNGHMVLLTKDHIVPSSKNGTNHQDNLQTLCNRCNILKGSLDVSIEELKKILAEQLPRASRRRSKRREKRILQGWRKRLNRARQLGRIMPKIEQEGAVSTPISHYREKP